MTQPTARARAPEPRARLPASLMDFLMYFLLPPNPEPRTQSPSPSAALSNGFPNVFPTAPEREIEPEPEPVCRPVCRFFLAQILTLRAHFHQILTLLSAFEFQNLGFAQILTLFGLFGGLTRTFSRNSSKSLPYSALLDFKISVLAKHRVTSAYLGAKSASTQLQTSSLKLAAGRFCAPPPP